MKFFILLTIIMSSLYAAPKGKKDKLPKVTLGQLKKGEISKTIDYYGKIRPYRVYRYYAPVDGVITSSDIKAGSSLVRGSQVLTLKRNEIGATLYPIKVKAPFKGIITHKYYNEHDFVRKNEPLFELFEGTKYKVSLHLTPDDALKISDKTFVTIYLNDIKYDARVVSVSPAIDIKTGTQEALISFKSEKLLNVGKLAKAVIAFEKKQGFLVDKKIIKEKNGKKYVRTLKDNKIEWTYVTVGGDYSGKVEVSSTTLNEELDIVIKSSREPLDIGEKVEISSEEKQKKEESKKDA